MLFGVLGPVEICAAERVHSLERSMRRAVLAFLLLHADRVVSLDRLEDALWGGAPPASARAQMHTAIYRIRQVLRAAGYPDQLVTTPGGYQMAVGPGLLDLSVFDERLAGARAAAESGRHDAAVESYRAALGLWRGPALGGASAAFVAAARHHLEDRRIVTHEDLVEGELALGRHAEVITELGRLIEANPLRERLTGQLMLALYRCGRQADALAAYHRLRGGLSDQLGIDPGREVRERHEAILRADPSLDLAPPMAVVTCAARHPSVAVVPRQLPPAAPHLVGREAELGLLTALADHESMVVAAIDGGAGIGKTALAVHCAHRLAHRFPDGQLYLNLRGFDPGGQPLSVSEAIRGLLDAFAVPARKVPATIDGQIGLYRSLLAQRRVLVVLDNARDTAQVRPLLPGAPGCLVLVTSRHQLSGLVTGGAHPLTLEVLPSAAARKLMVYRIGAGRMATEPAAVAQILAACAGLPLALNLVAARMAARPRLTLADLAQQLCEPDARLDALDLGDADASVRTVLSWSYRALSTCAARLFRLLALHNGQDVSLAAAASLVGLPPSRVRPPLAELTRAHLLQENVGGRYGYHDLIRSYAGELVAADGLAEERQAALRRLADHFLHTAHTATFLLNPHRIPIRLARAGDGVTVAAIGDHDAAMSWFTTEHAALLSTIEQAAAAGLHTHVWQLAWAIMTFLDRRGHRADWAATQGAALVAARRSGDLIGQAHAHRGLGRAYTHLSRLEDAGSHLNSALELYGKVDDPVGLAQTHLDLTWLHERRDDRRAALGHARKALELYRAAGHRYGLAGALNAVGWQHAQLGDYRRALECCREAIDIHREVGDRPGEADTWDSLGYAHHQLGEHAEAVACLRQAVELYRATGKRYVEAITLVSLGEAHQAAGEVDAARQAWRSAVTLFEEADWPGSADEVRARLEAL